MLTEIYEQLSSQGKPRSGTFAAEPVNCNWLRLGINELGQPVFIVQPSIDEQTPPFLPKSEYFEVSFRNSCRAKSDEESILELKDATFIKFLSPDGHLLKLFFEIFEVFWDSCNQQPSEHDIASRCVNYLELFKLAKVPKLKPDLGLWGELYFIDHSLNPDTTCDAWHEKARANYDFVFPNQFFEIKTTEEQNRKHRLKLSQLERSGGREGLICSIMTKESSNGKTCLELARSICEKVETVAAKDKMLAVISQFGFSDHELHDRSFCVETARETIAYFPTSELPRPQIQEKDKISGVSFMLDFEGLQSVDIQI